MDYLTGFSWAVPCAFLDAVGRCLFREGDVLYESQKAYSLPWGAALGRAHSSLQVRSSAASNCADEPDTRSVFRKNWSTEVRLDLYRRINISSAEEIVTTQGRLYTALWRGNLEILDKSSTEPEPPNGPSVALKHAARGAKMVKAIGDGKTIFVMPIDQANRAFRSKLSKVRAQLSSHLNTSVRMLSPREAGLPDWKTVAPTVTIAVFCVSGLSASDLEEAIRMGLLGSTRSTRKQRFRISSHGTIIGCNTQGSVAETKIPRLTSATSSV
jgi:hypothetical protein